MSGDLAKLSCITAILVAGAGLGGCVESKVFLSPDFGQAVRQDVVAQIADPDARYAGSPKPGANGSKAALAQRRYVAGEVIEPAATSTSIVASSGSGGSGAPPAAGGGH